MVLQLYDKQRTISIRIWWRWKIAIDIGSDGLPVVYSGSPYQLKVAKCLDQQCTAKKLTTVDETWDVNEDFFGID